MNRPEYQSVGKSVRKRTRCSCCWASLFTPTIFVLDALVVKLLRSPHANAIVETIDVSKAKKLPGVVDVYTWEDVPNERFSNAGQTYPETSPYDRLIIDRHVRFVGDVVAIVAAETEEAAEKALGRIKVTYNVLEPVLDFRAAKDNPVLVHPEDNWHMLCDLGGRQYAQPGGQHGRRRRRRGGGAGRLRYCAGTHLPHQGLQPGHDGDRSVLYTRA